MNFQETIVIVTCFIFEIHRFRNCSEDFLFPLTYVIENMEDDDILDLSDPVWQVSTDVWNSYMYDVSK